MTVSDEALERLRAQIAAEPSSPDAHVELARLLHACGRVPEALASYHNALLFAPDHPEAIAGLASAARALGQKELAHRSVTRALTLAPAHAGAHSVQGLLMQDRGDHEGAAVEFLRALASAPDQDATHLALGSSVYNLHTTGAIARATELAEQWRREHASHPVAAHLTAALLGYGADPRASSPFLRVMFDMFAPDFDAVLERLDYRAPHLLQAAITKVVGLNLPGDVLDAGCGTGLCAAWLREHARHLTGVDVSPAMLERAAARKCYDTLTESELVNYLARHRARFDLIVSADVLCYFGPLDEVMERAAAALRSGGVLGFTVEELDDSHAPHRLLPSGRYAHQRESVLTALHACGLDVLSADRVRLRREFADDVTGLLIVARKGADPNPGATRHRPAVPTTEQPTQF